MTIEQAVKILRSDETDDSFDWDELGLKGTEDFNRAYDEAYEMAIKALEESRLPLVTPKGMTVTDFADKCRECGKINHFGRWIPVTERLPEETGPYLITTKVEMYNLKPYYETNIAQFDKDFDIGYMGNGISVIAWMPLPEPYKVESERDCKTCKHSINGYCAGTEECHECMWDNMYEQQTCEDAISKQAMRDFISKWLSDYLSEIPEIIYEMLEEMTPVAPKPKIGYWKWQLADNGWADHICSECGFKHNTDIHVTLNWQYCPNCGAKMENDKQVLAYADQDTLMPAT